jgi:cleavage and polyadenylation specificity factor subunit 6/7
LFQHAAKILYNSFHHTNIPECLTFPDGPQNGGGMMDFDGSGGGGGGAGPSSTSISNDANSVFVTNLQWWTTDVELEGVLSQYGPIRGVRFIEDRACGKSRGMAVVEFNEFAASQACVENLGGTIINGRPCKVQRQQQRPPGGNMGGGNMMGMGMMPGGRGGGMQGGRGGGRGGRGGGMDPSMMGGMPPPWAMGGGGGGGPGGNMPMSMPPQMMGGQGGFRPPPPPGGPGYN